MLRKSLLFSEKTHLNATLLFIRLCAGFLMVYLHGWSKLMAGTTAGSDWVVR